MIVETTRFGQIDVDPCNVISIPRGLIGIPNSQRFILLDHVPGGPFKWLQSLDDPSLAFVTVDPYSFFPDYEVTIPDDQATALGVWRPEDVHVMTLVTIRSVPLEVTANLLGPLVIGAGSQRAVQLVLDDYRYSTRHRLPMACADPRAERREEPRQELALAV